MVATYNSGSTLTECLRSVRLQNYPKNKIEIILADGGSHDATAAIARTFGAKIIRVNSEKQGAEYNRAIGANASRNELLLFVDHDNVLPHADWLRNMIRPLQEDKRIVGVETLHYTYDRNDSLIGRYFALFGANDIFAYYIGKADRLPHFYDSPQHYGVFAKASVIDKGQYYIVEFAKNAIPTLGSNGFLVRKSVLFAHANVSPDEFFHIDVNVDLIRKGYNRYAFIKDSLHHKTDERGIVDYLRRRKLFMEKYHFISSSNRRYSVYETSDFFPTVRFVILSLTGIVPFADALRGFIKIHDIAWFLNPFMCFSLVILYGFVIIHRRISSYANNILGK